MRDLWGLLRESKRRKGDQDLWLKGENPYFPETVGQHNAWIPPSGRNESNVVDWGAGRWIEEAGCLL